MWNTAIRFSRLNYSCSKELTEVTGSFFTTRGARWSSQMSCVESMVAVGLLTARDLLPSLPAQQPQGWDLSACCLQTLKLMFLRWSRQRDVQPLLTHRSCSPGSSQCNISASAPSSAEQSRSWLGGRTWPFHESCNTGVEHWSKGSTKESKLTCEFWLRCIACILKGLMSVAHFPGENSYALGEPCAG